MFWAYFHDYCKQSKNEAVCSEVQTRFGDFHLATSKKRSSGRIFKIFASRNEGISREVQTHFGISLPASFTEKVLGQFHDLCVLK